MSARLTLRVATPSIAISLLLLFVGGVGGWYILGLQKSTADLVALDMATMRSVEQLVLSVTEVRSELAEYLATDDPSHLEALPAKSAQVERWLHETEQLVDDDDEIALARRVRKGFQGLQADIAELSRARSNAQSRRKVKELNDDLSVRGLLSPAQELLAREEQLNRKSHDYNLSMFGRIAFILGLLAVCGSAAGLVAGIGIARSVTRSIVELYVPVRAASGRLEQVVGPIDLLPPEGIEYLDVLLRQMAEQVGTVVDRLQQSQWEVLRGEQMAALGHLAAGLAHELRNPLTAMKILIQKAIKERPVNGLNDRDLKVLGAETARLEKSIQTFLDFARPLTLEKRLGDVRLALGQTLDLVRSRAEQQNVHIECSLPDRPLEIEADHEQLRQMFLNLMCNALDSLPQGGHISIGANSSSRISGAFDAPAELDDTLKVSLAGAKDLLTITVADDGPGIAEELCNRIFDAYVSTKETGLGLGLAICRRIARSHGGEITAGNLAAGGAVFTVWLPVELSTEQREIRWLAYS